MRMMIVNQLGTFVNCHLPLALLQHKYSKIYNKRETIIEGGLQNIWNLAYNFYFKYILLEDLVIYIFNPPNAHIYMLGYIYVNIIK